MPNTHIPLMPCPPASHMPSRGSFTFVHAADLHLDAPFRGVTRQIGSDGETGKRLRTLLADATFTAFERLVQTCISVQADFLLLAGDVYNIEESSLRAYFLLHEGFSRLQRHGIRVFLAHGNHDPLPPSGQKQAWPENVTVFGPTPEAHTVMCDGAPIATVHGISHANGKESRNLAEMFQGHGDSGTGTGYHVGVLHCALQGETGKHGKYAPCAGTDLLAGGMHYFALGHIHSCMVFRPKESSPAYESVPLSARRPPETPGAPVVKSRLPLYAYSGSSQGLHVNESGPHGCLVIKVDEALEQQVAFVPLASLEWENLSVSLNSLEQDGGGNLLPLLEDLLVEQLSRLATEEAPPGTAGEQEQLPGAFWQPSARIVRVELTGRTGLHSLLRKPENIRDLEDHLARSLAGTGVWLRDIIVSTRPPSAIEGLECRDDFMGELARHALALQNDTAALLQAGEEAFAPLYKSIRMRRKLPKPDASDLPGLLEEAKLACFDLLGGEE